MPTAQSLASCEHPDNNQNGHVYVCIYGPVHIYIQIRWRYNCLGPTNPNLQAAHGNWASRALVSTRLWVWQDHNTGWLPERHAILQMSLYSTGVTFSRMVHKWHDLAQASTKAFG